MIWTNLLKTVNKVDGSVRSVKEDINDFNEIYQELLIKVSNTSLNDLTVSLGFQL